jgi:transposase-like protein
MEIKKGKPGRRHKYDLSLKRKVCEELLSGTITVREVARKYNIPAGGGIKYWIRWYQEEQAELAKLQPMPTEPINSDTSKSASNSSADSQQLQEELRLAKIRLTTLETMIDIAEKQFHIEIRKKSGTKPLEE